MRKEKIAVLGDKDLILAFKAIGMDVFSANTAGEAQEQIKLLARNYSVIFITENLAEMIEEDIEKYRTRAYPAIIPIPSSKGASGFGMAGIKKDVERAVGTDILFNQD